ncbi:hypothetical protein [Mycobacterium sp. E740]|uniref:hypothetical protein n=1 Tax=Mycobacterium sp. E740 TaxID=1834149 RepID=UPI0008013D7C|nr:hypothetical protein [Mycobacterium sp. E740]OBI78080.1 hypothetical protein A5663_21030 [Mycobacterium sp. E740]
MSARVTPRGAVVVSVLTLVVAVVGFFVTLALTVFVFDEFDAYGEVPIPGSGSVQLPAGDVTVSFHTMTAGQPRSGFAIPQIRFNIEAPDGAPDPVTTQSIGETTTFDSDTHVPVWVVQAPEANTYRVSTDGDVSGYIDPRLAFGHNSSHGRLLWLWGGLAALGAVGLIAALIWSARTRKAARPLDD